VSAAERKQSVFRSVLEKLPDLLEPVPLSGNTIMNALNWVANNSKSELLLKYFNETYLSLTLDQCFNATVSDNSIGHQLRNFDQLSLCLVDWQSVGFRFLTPKDVPSRQGPLSGAENWQKLENLQNFQQSSEPILVADLVHEFLAHFVSFFRPRPAGDDSLGLQGAALGALEGGSDYGTSQAGSEFNFQLAKFTYLSSSALLSFVGIVANLLILGIIFINTKVRYQHHFSCWYCCWWRLLASSGGRHRGGSCTSIGASRSGGASLSASNAAGGNGNCVTSHHYLSLFQLTLTGLLVASYIFIDSVNIYQVDRRAKIINDYEQSLPVVHKGTSNVIKGRRLLMRELDKNLLSFEQSFHGGGAPQVQSSHLEQFLQQTALHSPLSMFLPPTPFQSHSDAFPTHLAAHSQPETTLSPHASNSLNTKLAHKLAQTSRLDLDHEKLQRLSSTRLVLLLNMSTTANERPTESGRIVLQVEQLDSGKGLQQSDLSSRVHSFRVLKLNDHCDSDELTAESPAGFQASSKEEQPPRRSGRTSSLSAGMVFNLLATVHLWMVAALAYDRYCAIAHPLEYLRAINTSRAKTFMLFLWSFALLLNVVLPLLLNNYHNQTSASTEPLSSLRLMAKLEPEEQEFPVCLSAPQSRLLAECDQLQLDLPGRVGVLMSELLAESETSHEKCQADRLLDSLSSLGQPGRGAQSSSTLITVHGETLLSLSNFMLTIVVPLLIISICNLSIYGIVKIHERRLSASSSSNGNGSIHSRPLADQQHRQSACFMDKSDTSSIGSSIIGRLVRASAQVGLMSAAFGTKQTSQAADLMGLESGATTDACYFSTTSCCGSAEPHQQAQTQTGAASSNCCSTEGSDLISFSPNKNYFFEDRTLHRERSGSLRLQPSRRDSTVSQWNGGCLGGAHRTCQRRMQNNLCSTRAAHQQQEGATIQITSQEKGATTTGQEVASNGGRAIRQAQHNRLRQKLSDRCQWQSAADSRRSSFAFSDCCQPASNCCQPTSCNCCHQSSFAAGCQCRADCFGRGQQHNNNWTNNQQQQHLSSKRRDSRDGIMHQLKMAGLSFAGIAISDINQFPTDYTGNHSHRASLNRSSSCSLWNLASSQPLGSNGLPLCSCQCERSRRASCTHHCGCSSSSQPPASHQHLHQSNHSSLVSVNKCTNNAAQMSFMHNHESPARDCSSFVSAHAPRRSYVSMSNHATHGNASAETKYCTKVIDPETEHQLGLSSMSFVSCAVSHSHHQASGSTRSQHFSMGTKSGIFNTVVWMALALFLLTIPCYLVPIVWQIVISKNSPALTNGATDITLRQTSHRRLLQFFQYLLSARTSGQLDTGQPTLRALLAASHADQSLADQSQADQRTSASKDSTTYWLELCFLWLSCACRVFFLTMISLHAWLYGIRSRSLKATLKTVLRRYVSKKQASIEINQRRKSNSSLRSRDSSLYCFPNYNNANSLHSVQPCCCCHTGRHSSQCSRIQGHLTRAQGGQSHDSSGRAFRRCASFNLSPASSNSNRLNGARKDPLGTVLSVPTGVSVAGQLSASPNDHELETGQQTGARNSDYCPTKGSHCNSIRFVIGDHSGQKFPGDSQEAALQQDPVQPAGQMDNLPAPQKQTISATPKSSVVCCNNAAGVGNSVSAASSRYSSLNSSLNSSLADSSRSLLTASIQSSHSAAYMLLAEQSLQLRQPPDEPRPLCGVLKRPASHQLEPVSDRAAPTSSPPPSGNLHAERSCSIDQVGRTKSLDCYGQESKSVAGKVQQFKLESSASGVEATGRAASAQSRLMKLKKFATISTDSHTSEGDPREMISPSPIECSSASHLGGQETGDEVGESQRLLDDEEFGQQRATMDQSSFGGRGGHVVPRKLSSDIKFLLTPVDQSEATRLDISDETASFERAHLGRGSPAEQLPRARPISIKFDSLDSGESLDQADETTEMLPNKCRNDHVDIPFDHLAPMENGTEYADRAQVIVDHESLASKMADEKGEHDFSAISGATSRRGSGESTMRQIRNAVSRYVSGIKSKAVPKQTTSGPTNRSHLRSINQDYCPADVRYDRPIMANYSPLARKYSDSTATSSSANGKTVGPFGHLEARDDHRMRRSSLDSHVKTFVQDTHKQQQKKICKRNQMVLQCRESSQTGGCDLKVVEKQRRNSLSMSEAAHSKRHLSSARDGGILDKVGSSSPLSFDNAHHQIDLHHLKPPKCLNIFFEPNSNQQIYSSNQALSPIKECSANHSCASSQSSLSNAYSNASMMKQIHHQPGHQPSPCNDRHTKQLDSNEPRDQQQALISPKDELTSELKTCQISDGHLIA